MTLREQLRSGALLDIDGTLIDSNDAHAQAWTDALRAHGHKVAFHQVRRCIGMGSDRLLAVAANVDHQSRHGVEIVETKHQLFTRALPGLKPTCGARRLLQRLMDMGVRLVTATSAGDDERTALLCAAGVDDLIDLDVPKQEVAQSKPAPDVVHAALRRAGLLADEAFMLGDTPYDIKAAKRSGVPIVALRCGGFWPDGALAAADLICDHPGAFSRAMDERMPELMRAGTAQ